MDWTILIAAVGGILVGATCMSLIYETRRAPLYVDWHSIGRTMQRMWRRDKDDLPISEN